MRHPVEMRQSKPVWQPPPARWIECRRQGGHSREATHRRQNCRGLIEDLLPKSPAYRQAARILFADEEPIEGRPLTPLHGGHVGLLCTAGMLNGIFGEGQSRHIAHWQSVKVVDKTEEQNEDGTLTIREKERFANELTLAFANGRVTTLK